MSAKIYWNLLVLFGVLCQGIINTFAEINIDESSELLVRQKRVINRFADIKGRIRNSPYITVVRALRSPHSCVGVILSDRIVLTLAHCVMHNMEYCRVYSGTARNITTGTYVAHNVTDIRPLMTNNPGRPSEEGIALITVTPRFIYSLNTRSIGLYEGPIYPGLYGTISGWGCNAGADPGTAHRNFLRSIYVPLISTHDCARFYEGTNAILDSDICTLDVTGNQYCCHDDAGAPFVTTVNNEMRLVGIHLPNGRCLNGRKPDVFANLQHPRYRIWIARTIDILNHNDHA